MTHARRLLVCLAGGVALAAAGPAGAARGTDYKVIAEALYPEGPVIVDGALWYAEMTGDRVTRIAGEERTVFEMPAGCGPTAVARYGETRLVVLCHRSGGLKILSREGVLVGAIDEDIDGAPLTYPNDAYEDRRGGVYFSSSGPFNARAQPAGRVMHLRADGTVHTVAQDIVYANGVFVTSDAVLLVSEHIGHRILRYRIRDDGALEALSDLADATALGLAPHGDPLVGPDGIEMATDGRVFVAIYGAGKALVLTAQGAVVAEITVPFRFLTNIVLDQARRRAILTGATSNTVWPYAGAVIEVALP
jgi:sugar lactone lactonase YvrE